MQLLVTGGSGYLGAAILKRAPHNWKLAATYFAHPIESPGVAAFCVDVRDADAIHRLFDELRPDVVVHTAALMSGDEMSATNADGSRNIARAAAQHRARLVHLSSDVIFDGEHAPYTENDTPAPITSYGESKVRAERAVIEECSSAVLVRTSLIYGFDPIDPRTQQILDGAMPRLFTDEYRCPIFVDDLADALIEIAGQTSEVLKTSEVSVLNIAGAQRLSRYKLGVKLANAFHTVPRFEPALCASHPAPRPRDCTLDISRAQRILKTKLRGVDDVLPRINE